MINIYDFISSNSSYFDQLQFGKSEIFIDYYCPIKESRAHVWSHKNCLMYVMEGTKGYASAGFYHESHEHQVLFVRKGGYLLHQRFEKPYHALIFMFEDFSIKKFLDEYPDVIEGPHPAARTFIDEPVVLELPSSPFVESIFVSSLQYLKHPSPESHISIELKFKELLVNLLREKVGNRFYFYLSSVFAAEDASFRKLMVENRHCNFTAEQLARVVGMSLSSFKRRFRENFGTAPGKWLAEQRISNALALLRDSNKTISEIAFELGYNDVSAFGKALKRVTGSTPGDYRERSLH